MDQEFFAKYSDKLLAKSKLSINGQCRLWQGGTNADGYGVIQIQVKAKWKKITCHRLAYIVHHQVDLSDTPLDVSHLCHNHLCVTPTHLSLEPHPVNNNRQACISAGQCMGHKQYPDCMFPL